MLDIMVLLACVRQYLASASWRQLGQVTEAMLSISGRVTMRGLARWTGKGGSYRTIQRFFQTPFDWCQLQWLLIRQHFLDADEVVVLSGDDVVVTKAGKTTYGLDRFFSSLYGKAVPGLCFLTLSLLSVTRRTSYPIVTEQVEKAHGTSAAASSPPRDKRRRQGPQGGQQSLRGEEAMTVGAVVPAPPHPPTGGRRGRPKGSTNRNRREVELSPALRFLQEQMRKVLQASSAWSSYGPLRTQPFSPL